MFEISSIGYLRNMNIQRLTIYCASSAQIDQAYFKATESLAKYLVKAGIEIVCGGGANGLMGQLADTAIAEGGKIKGIMPRFMRDIEWAHKGITDFHYTETMAERKKLFFKDIDGIVALAGSSGTWEELFEAITLKRLGKLNVPIVILNTNGYYDELKKFMERSIQEKFMDERHLQLWSFVEKPEDVLRAIKESPTWSEDSIKFATLQ